MTRALLLMLLSSLLTAFSLHAQSEKKALTPEDFNGWKLLRNQQLSPNGQYASYEINAQIGDGTLHLKDFTANTDKAFPRGYKATFAGDQSFLAFSIKAPFDSTRKAKMAKKKGDQLPKDSLGVYHFSSGELMRLPKVKSFKVAPKGGNWLAYVHKPEPKKPAKDTTATAEAEETEETKAGEAEEKKPEEAKAAKGKKRGKGKGKGKAKDRLEIIRPGTESTYSVDKVKSYAFSADGSQLAILTTFGDSIDSVAVQVFDTQTESFTTVYSQPGKASSMAWDEQGQKLAFLASTDTSKVKIYGLQLWNKGDAQAQTIVQSDTKNMPDGWAVSEHQAPNFTEDGQQLYFGTAPAPEESPEDTLTADEKVKVDVWSWTDKRLQPMQKVQLNRDKKKNYAAVYHLEKEAYVQLADEQMDRVSTPRKKLGPLTLGYDGSPYQLSRSWDIQSGTDIYLVNTETGERKRMLAAQAFPSSLSPDGTYFIYYQRSDRAWYAMPVAGGEAVNLTGKLKVDFFNERHDSPSQPYPYGITGWTEGDEFVLINDRFDIWKIDPTGKKKPFNLTRGHGRKNTISYNYVALDREADFVSETMMLRGYNETTKEDGMYQTSLSSKKAPTPLLVSNHRYSTPRKAKEADRVLWTRQSYTEFPDLWTSNTQFDNGEKISNANPQQKDFLWGSVELVKWTSYEGKELEGLLYKPENFDPEKKYPLLVYFYERISDRYNSYSMPAPSRSTVYPSYYNSNGYAIFMPNIEYTTGQPGDDAYDAVVSGTEAMAKEHTWIDQDKMALQGQSWGGYQTAYIITKTNLYAAAMAGAPVSNMTSAYGGIRWGTGMSRMFQYEQTQSRLGATLWEDQDRYIKNSPLFFAPNVKTPLMMMHNDKDTAVPWYQGIEFFVALRRLRKPVWMVVYNEEPHNLARWANRKDLTIRMHQFFDHYLKDEPMPIWMSQGIPALEKGKNLGYELDSSTKKSDK